MNEDRFPALVEEEDWSPEDGCWAFDERREKRVLSQFLTLDSSFGELGDGFMGVTSSLLAEAAASRMRREDWSSIEVRRGVGSIVDRGAGAGVGEAGSVASSLVEVVVLVMGSVVVVVVAAVVSAVGEVASGFWDLRFSFARRFSSSRAAFSSASLAFFSSLSCSTRCQYRF